MLPLIAGLLFPTESYIDNTTRNCAKDQWSACSVANDALPLEGWMNSAYAQRDALVFAMVPLPPEKLETWCTNDDMVLACAALGLAGPDPKWLRVACERGDITSCGQYAFYGFADADTDERQDMQDLSLDACRRGSGWGCAAYADHTRVAPETGDLQAALGWSQVSCTLTWQHGPCAAAGRLLAHVGESEASEAYHQKACARRLGLTASCDPGRGNDRPLSVDVVEQGEEGLDRIRTPRP
ncbi:MAG: hypothetical protein R3F61_06345 [Myxococcota bacterium]